MKNITVAIDDETYRLARIRAAENNTSVSALVRDYLTTLMNDHPQAEAVRRHERMKREEDEILARIRDFDASDRLTRDEVHDRTRSR